ncbi:MAG: DUF4178 domain-containing protein [Phormidesmis sp. RL_2_1]|nr:DUF4178 domain-containing protein [Phormidesmis sp. RL_2_1]
MIGSIEMFIIPDANGGTTLAEFHQDEFIDFPVWVLSQCGISAPPFTTHVIWPDRPQLNGLDQASWENWFRRVICFRHTCSRIQREGSSYAVEQKNRLSSVPLLYNGHTGFDLSDPEYAESVLDWYQKLAVRLLKPADIPLVDTVPSVIDSPVELWQGDESVKKELGHLWLCYQTSPYCRVHHASDLHRLLVRDDAASERVNAALRGAIGRKNTVLMFNFVNYPDSVAAVFGPSIVIGLSRDQPFSLDIVEEQIRMATQRFGEVAC